MEALIYLDTHVVVWLFTGEIPALSARACAAIESEDLRISPMAALEIDFLKEVGRLRVGATEIVDSLRRSIGLEVCDLAFPSIIACARSLTWARDPFDRVIVGHAVAAGRPLVTKDRSIRRRLPSAIW